MQTVELHAGRLRLALRPELGGSVEGLWHGEHAVLVPGPRGMASFPLVPYSNRLGFRRFTWQGVDYTTAPNFEGSPHSLHGVGWLREWELVSRSECSATLLYRHEPDEHWPFAFEAEQLFELTDGALLMRLRVTNTDTREQPMGLGWHPYFPRRARSHMRMDLSQRWELDPLQIPTHAVPLAGIDADLSTLAYDHCFAGWTGPALIEDDCFKLELSSTLDHAVVFTPAVRDFFCVEPVSHVNDAIHLDDPFGNGLLALKAGGTAEAAMTLRITPL